MTLYRCTDCGEEKDATQFFIDKRYNKPRTRCKRCFTARSNWKKNPQYRSPEQRAEMRRRVKPVMRPYKTIDKILADAEWKREEIKRIKAQREHERAAAKIGPPKRPRTKSQWYAQISPERVEAYRKQQREKFAKRYAENTEAEVARVSRYKARYPDAYLRYQIADGRRFSPDQVTDEMIETVRLHRQIKRYIRENKA